MGHFSIQIYANFSRQQNVLVINFQMVMCNIYIEKRLHSVQPFLLCKMTETLVSIRSLQ